MGENEAGSVQEPNDDAGRQLNCIACCILDEHAPYAVLLHYLPFLPSFLPPLLLLPYHHVLLSNTRNKCWYTDFARSSATDHLWLSNSNADLIIYTHTHTHA